MLLRIKNNLDKNVLDMELEDVGGSSLFYHFEANPDAFKDVPDGEYTYFLYREKCGSEDEMELLNTGILQVGDYVQENTQYETAVSDDDNDNTFFQYNG